MSSDCLQLSPVRNISLELDPSERNFVQRYSTIESRCSLLKLRFRSFRRWWNRLSRLQRYVIYVTFSFASLCLMLVLPWISDSAFMHGINLRKNDIVFYFGISLNQKPQTEQEVNTYLPVLVGLKEKNLPSSKDDVQNVVLQKFNLYSRNKNNNIPRTNKDRQEAVVSAFLHAWNGYKIYAWGHDHLKPISKTFQDWFGLGLTIVDSLDTLHIMNLQEEFAEATDWVKEKLDFKVNKDVNFFETTIRVLGGLLSAFHMSKEPIFLLKATDLGNRLMPCFQSSSGVPYSDVNLQTGHAHSPSWGQDSTVSEVSTVQLEFRDLSYLTNDKKYEEAAFKVSLHLHQLPKKDGLVPMFINADNGQFRATSTLTVGARADSYYEYLLKQWIQTGRTIDWLKQDYIKAIDGMLKHLVKMSEPNKLTFVGELLSGQSFSPKMDHLVCYLPGTLALGYHYGLPSSHLQFALELMETCYNLYSQTATFLSPEIAYFNLKLHGKRDIIIKSNDAHNLLRPETVESLWYLFYITRNETYREWGWNIFQAFEKYAKVEHGGYTSIGDVRNNISIKPRDFMESFFLAETLKYLYLLFSDEPENYSLDHFIFNSEAHLLPVLL